MNGYELKMCLREVRKAREAAEAAEGEGDTEQTLCVQLEGGGKGAQWSSTSGVSCMCVQNDASTGSMWHAVCGRRAERRGKGISTLGQMCTSEPPFPPLPHLHTLPTAQCPAVLLLPDAGVSVEEERRQRRQYEQPGRLVTLPSGGKHAG